MVLQGSWTPNEVTEDTGYDDTWGFFRGLQSKTEQMVQRVL